jgi:hypothetical protein
MITPAPRDAAPSAWIKRGLPLPRSFHLDWFMIQKFPQRYHPFADALAGLLQGKCRREASFDRRAFRRAESEALEGRTLLAGHPTGWLEGVWEGPYTLSHHSTYIDATPSGRITLDFATPFDEYAVATGLGQLTFQDGRTPIIYAAAPVNDRERFSFEGASPDGSTFFGEFLFGNGTFRYSAPGAYPLPVISLSPAFELAPSEDGRQLTGTWTSPDDQGTIELTRRSLPDLTGSLSVNQDLLPLEPGGPAYWRTTVRNIGAASAGRSYSEELFISRNTVLDASDIGPGSATVHHINSDFAAGASINGYEGIQLPEDLAPGDYYPILKITPATGVVESNSSNNVIVGQKFTIGRTTVISEIRGRVVDAAGFPLHGVKVTASNAGGAATAVTDYNGASNSLDELVNGDFQVIGGFDRARPVSLTIEAHGLGGVVFKHTVSVSAGQFVNGIASLSTPIKLTAFKTIAGSNIVLLDDQRNNYNDHAIRRRGLSGEDAKVTASARYRSEVKAVTRKLASLGFRQSNGSGTGVDAPVLAVTDKWASTSSSTTVPPAAERALLLFQTLWFHKGNNDHFKNAITANNRTKVSGKVDTFSIGQNTLKALNEAKGAIWVYNGNSVSSTHPNSGMYASNNKNRWMHASVARVLAAVTPTAQQLGISKLQLNGNAPATGLRILDDVVTSGHHTGGDIDFAWITTAGAAGSANFFRPLKKANGTFTPVKLDSSGVPLQKETVNGVVKQREWTDADRAAGMTEAQAIAKGRLWRTKNEYSRSKTKALIEALLAQSGVHQIIFNDPAFLPGGSMVINVPPSKKFLSDNIGPVSPVTSASASNHHNNHIHVGVHFDRAFFLPPALNGEPLFPG